MSYISAIFIILIHTTITSSFQSNISILIKEAPLIKKYTSIVPQHTTSSFTRFTQRRRTSYHRSIVKTTMVPKENHTFDYSDGIDYQEGDIDIHSEDIESVLYQPTRDNKRLPKVSNTQFLLTTLVGVPVWATILLPITLVYQIAKSILPSTLLSSNTDIFFYNTKSDAGSQNFKMQLLAGTDSSLYQYAPYIEVQSVASPSSLNLNIGHDQSLGGDFNVVAGLNGI